MALSQKEIKRIEVMKLLAGGKWFCPQNRRAPTLSLRRVDVDFLFAHREMRNTNSRLIWIASPERGGAAKGGGGVQPDDRPHASRSFGRIAAAGRSAEGEGSPGDFRSSARRRSLCNRVSDCGAALVGCAEARQWIALWRR